MKRLLKTASKFSNNGTISKFQKKTLLDTYRLKYKSMPSYCLKCKRHTANSGSEKVMMRNKVITNKSRCAICNSKKSVFLKQKHNKKVVGHYKTNMLTYCLKCKKIQKNIDSKMVETKNGRLMLSSKCAMYGSEKSRIMKEKEAEGLLSNLGIKAPLNRIPILGDVLF